ncbi:hypothetical protein SARC_11323, partial [Sphaeroforma arctica JP610]
QVVVDFHALWCGPCKRIAPDVKNLAKKYAAAAVFLKVDVDQLPETAQMYSVRSMPTFMFFLKGNKVDQFSGANVPKLEQTIKYHLPDIKPTGGFTLGSTPAQSSSMWYEGNAAEAVQCVGSSGQLLLVYITDPDGDSSAWDSNEVRRALSLTDTLGNKVALCLKLVVGEEACTQFSSVYPVLKTPTTYFLSPLGVPYEVFTDDHTSAKVTAAIKSAVAMHSANKTASAPAATPTTTAPAATPQSPKTTSAADTTAQTADKGKGEASSAADKAAELKKKVQQRRESNIADERAREKEAELSRRKNAKEILEAERKRKEEGLKQLQVDIKQQRVEDAEARQRIKQKIQEDRQEKIRREAERKTLAAQRQDGHLDEGHTSTRANQNASFPTATTNKNCANAQIQFRFSDGSVHRHTFTGAQGATLADVCAYLSDNHRNMAGADPRLHMTFPPRVFGAEDMQSTLNTLGLTPSATVMVKKPVSANLFACPPGGGGSLVSSNPMNALYTMIVACFIYIRNVIGLGDRPGSGSASTPDPMARVNNSRLLRGGSKANSSKASTDTSDTGSMRKRNTGTSTSGTTTSRNVHKFRNNDDDDRDKERNEAYNGNSTAQQ